MQVTIYKDKFSRVVHLAVKRDEMIQIWLHATGVTLSRLVDYGAPVSVALDKEQMEVLVEQWNEWSQSLGVSQED